MRDVSAEEVHRIMDQEKDAVVIDVLSRESYAEKHVPGSISVPSGEPGFLHRIEEKVPSKDTPVVLYCSGPACGASPAAARRLEEAGYRDVREFRGGLEEWESARLTFEGSPGEI